MRIMRLAGRAQPAVFFQCVQRLEQCHGLGPGGGGRLIGEGQLRGIPYAPGRKIENETGQIRLQDLGPVGCGKGRCLPFVPETIADAGLRSPRRVHVAGRPRRGKP